MPRLPWDSALNNESHSATAFSPEPEIRAAVPAAASHSSFSTAHLRFGLARRSARGAASTLAGRACKFALQLAGTVFLARLLTPSDFGLVGMAGALTGFMTMFSDFGLSTATIQETDIDQDQMSTLFWLNSALGLGIAIITGLLAPVVAWFYHDPRLFQITMPIAFGIFITGLGIQHQALLKRQMRFGALAAIDVGSGCLAVLVAIAAAWAHCGYWSLVVMQLTMAAGTTAGSWTCSNWHPDLPRRGTAIRKMVVFGRNITTSNFLNYIVRNLDNVLIGRYSGAMQLGFYSRAYQLMLLPISQLVGPAGAIAIPALSRLQSDIQRYRTYYLEAVKIIAYLTMPMIVTMAVFSRDIVYVTLGPKWNPTAELFRILALAALFQPVLSSVGWVYTSLGLSRTMMIWGLISSPVMVVAFIAGMHWGPRGVAWGYAIGEWALAYPYLRLAAGTTPIQVRDYFAVVHRPLALSAILATSESLFRMQFSSFGPSGVLAGGLLVSIFAVTISAIVWPGLRNDLRSMTRSFELIWRRQMPSGQGE